MAIREYCYNKCSYWWRLVGQSQHMVKEHCVLLTSKKGRNSNTPPQAWSPAKKYSRSFEWRRLAGCAIAQVEGVISTISCFPSFCASVRQKVHTAGSISRRYFQNASILAYVGNFLLVSCFPPLDQLCASIPLWCVRSPGILGLL